MSGEEADRKIWDRKMKAGGWQENLWQEDLLGRVWELDRGWRGFHGWEKNQRGRAWHSRDQIEEKGTAEYAEHAEDRGEVDLMDKWISRIGVRAFVVRTSAKRRKPSRSGSRKA